MANQMLCETCKFQDSNVCHRYPPTLTTVVLPGPPDLMGRNSLQLHNSCLFPQVADDSWCGEWQQGHKKSLLAAA